MWTFVTNGLVWAHRPVEAMSFFSLGFLPFCILYGLNAACKCSCSTATLQLCWLYEDTVATCITAGLLPNATTALLAGGETWDAAAAAAAAAAVPQQNGSPLVDNNGASSSGDFMNGALNPNTNDNNTNSINTDSINMHNGSASWSEAMAGNCYSEVYVTVAAFLMVILWKLYPRKQIYTLWATTGTTFIISGFTQVAYVGAPTRAAPRGSLHEGRFTDLTCAQY